MCAHYGILFVNVQKKEHMYICNTLVHPLSMMVYNRVFFKRGKSFDLYILILEEKTMTCPCQSKKQHEKKQKEKYQLQIFASFVFSLQP
jgi:hypothetical protein